MFFSWLLLLLQKTTIYFAEQEYQATKTVETKPWMDTSSNTSSPTRS